MTWSHDGAHEPPAPDRPAEGAPPRTGRTPAHPALVAIDGGTATARAELADRLARALAPELLAGRVRHAEVAADDGRADGHPSPAAVEVTAFPDGTTASRRTRGPGGLLDRHYDLIECDVVLADGPVDDAVPTLLLLEPGERPARERPPAEVIATVGAGPRDGELDVPHHRVEEVAALASLVRTRILHGARRTPLYGLVLVGGKSTRMGREKWALDYRGEPHVRTLVRLLSAHAERTFLSLRPDQRDRPGLGEFPFVVDSVAGMGPLGGILSAMRAHPDAAWLVLACDLPFVRDATIRTLLAARAPLRFATAYRSPHDGLPEPLCAIYEPKARLRLFQVAALGRTCPRKMLMNARIATLDAAEPHDLTNANHPHDYERALDDLRAGGREWPTPRT